MCRCCLEQVANSLLWLSETLFTRRVFLCCEKVRNRDNRETEQYRGPLCPFGRKNITGTKPDSLTWWEVTVLWAWREPSARNQSLYAVDQLRVQTVLNKAFTEMQRDIGNALIGNEIVVRVR